MKKIITLREILNARYPKGSRQESKASKIEEARKNNARSKQG